MGSDKAGFVTQSFPTTFQIEDLANAVILVFVLLGGIYIFAFPKLAGMLDFVFSIMFVIVSTPRAPSRSNHYGDKLGGYHKMLICTLNPPSASP